MENGDAALDTTEPMPTTRHPVYSKSRLMKKRKADLVTICTDLGITIDGTKPILAKRIMESQGGENGGTMGGPSIGDVKERYLKMGMCEISSLEKAQQLNKHGFFGG